MSELMTNSKHARFSLITEAFAEDANLAAARQVAALATFPEDPCNGKQMAALCNKIQSLQAEAKDLKKEVEQLKAQLAKANPPDEKLIGTKAYCDAYPKRLMNLMQATNVKNLTLNCRDEDNILSLDLDGDHLDVGYKYDDKFTGRPAWRGSGKLFKFTTWPKDEVLNVMLFSTKHKTTHGDDFNANPELNPDLGLSLAPFEAAQEFVKPKITKFPGAYARSEEEMKTAESELAKSKASILALVNFIGGADLLDTCGACPNIGKLGPLASSHAPKSMMPETPGDSGAAPDSAPTNY